MELKYQFVLVIGLLVVAVLLFLSFVKKANFTEGKKIAGMYGLENSAYFKRKQLIYKILKVLISFSYIATVAISFLLLAYPYTTSLEKEDQYKRDIILSMDISSSVDDLNMKLVDELKDTVNELKGERFGIVIFNSTAVMICPLTDDYEYVISVLDEIHNSLEMTNNTEDDDWLVAMEYRMAGTLGGENGSSLIGDGLASSVYDFPEISEKRSRIIIFSTDNDVQGTPIYTLQEAANVCKKNEVTVYGIGTAEMYPNNAEDMRIACEATGGKMYRQGESGNVESIVANINKEAKSLVKGKVTTREIPLVKVPIILLCITFAMQIIVAKFLKL